MFCRFSILVLCVCCVEVSAELCKSMDIRSPTQDVPFERLKNCTKLVGYLKLVLLEDVPSYPTFTALKEITGYLMVFVVANLYNLGDIFPNLVLIRGNILFQGNSLIIHHNNQMQKIGLYNLREIQNGHVIIGKCPNLCYVHTIDWSALGTSLSKLADIPECKLEECAPDCEGHCWSPGKCQKRSENCHPECLGCSKPNSTEHCEVCKNFQNGDRCVRECPAEKFIDEETMSCLTEEECRSSILGGRWVFQRYCIPRNTCLGNYEFTEKTSPPSCVRCKGICNKTCKAISLSTKASIDSLKGCTHLVGNLELKISDIYVIDELERSLGDLKEIDGCLKVARSSAISSLRFLKSLKRITGRNKEKQCRNYTVFIYDNTNLKTLIEVDRIETSGDVSIGFHDNPELCVSEIRKFASKLGISNENFDAILKKAKDVSPYSNGDKDPCADLQLNVTVTEYNPTNVTLQWESYEAQNVTVIGYTIFYILASDLAAERTNDISSNMCENNGWKSRFVSNNSRTVQLAQLYPFSLYIYWIKVYHIQDEMSGISGSTEKKSFTTLPDDPSAPVSFEVVATSPTTINITWESPYHTNGNLSHFQLIVLIEKDDPKFVSRRNYCMYPHIDAPVAEKTKEPIKNWLNTSENGSCQCVINIYRLNERFCGPLSDGFSFSNDDCNRFLYQIMDKPKNITKRYLLQDKSQPKVNPNDTVVDIKLPANETNFVLQNLKPFTTYLILFSACNQKFRGKYQCSAVLFGSERTKANVSADRISNLNLKVLKNEEAILSWDDPPNPNSMIVAYNIEYKSGDNSQAVNLPAPDCITRTQHMSSGRIYRITYYIDPGVYSIRVRPISLYGIGLYSNPVTLRIHSPLKTWLIYLFVCIVFVIFVVIIIVYLWYKRKKTLESIHLITSVNPDYASAFYVQDDWEVDRNDVEITNDLGEGSFGVVRYGYIKSKKLPCAVKTIGKDKSLSYKTEFLNEASVMKQFSGGYHVVKLYGVVSISDPPLVLMELMERGDLKEYLRTARESSRGISSPELYQMAAQIADGMAYLSAKKFVHRDLAARNCMVAADRTVKIGDFGMTKDIYMHDYYRKGTTGLLPVRWMAPESLADGIFSSESDIWSYGVILWEMITLAEQPYQGMSNDQVLNFVISRGRLGRPDECPDLLWEIMEACWKHRPKDRPLFLGIVELLEPLASPSFALVSFYHSREGREYRLNSRQREIIEHNATFSEPYQSSLYMLEEDNDVLIPQDEDFYPSNTRAFKREPFNSEHSSRSISNTTS